MLPLLPLLCIGAAIFGIGVAAGSEDTGALNQRIKELEAKLRENEAELTRLGADIGVRNDRIYFLLRENASLREQIAASYRRSA